MHFNYLFFLLFQGLHSKFQKDQQDKKFAKFIDIQKMKDKVNML